MMSSFSLLGSIVDRFPPMPLYWSDLQRIIKIGTDRGLKLTISIGKEDFDNLEHLREEHGDRVKQLRLKFYDAAYTSISISMGTGGVRISTSKDEKLLMASMEIKEAFAERLPVQAVAMRPYTWTVIGASVLYIAAHNNWRLSQNIAQCAAVILPFYLSLLSFHYVATNSVVYLKRKHEIESFWSRYGEKALWMIGGSALTVVGQLFVHQVTK